MGGIIQAVNRAAELHEALGEVLTGTKTQGERTSGGSISKGINLNDKAVQARHEIRQLLILWAVQAHDLAEHAPAKDWDALPAWRLANYIARYAWQLSEHQLENDLLEEFEDATRPAIFNLAYPVQISYVNAGQCECGGTLKLDVTEYGGSTNAFCRSCRKTSDVRGELDAKQPETMRIPDAAIYASRHAGRPISQDVIRGWIRRGSLTATNGSLNTAELIKNVELRYLGAA